jgi:hypothetical protein
MFSNGNVTGDWLRGPSGMEPIAARSFEAAELVRDFPPRWEGRNKKAVWEVSSQGEPFAGVIRYARWPARDWPAEVPGARPFLVRDGVFDYPAAAGADTVDWHLNFADPLLFGFYASDLMAQDELQVTEHPALGSLRDALAAQGAMAQTTDGRGPTPITVAGVQRRCEIRTQADPASGRPGSLYGNAFSRAPLQRVLAATRRIDPPTLSNILALAAPGGGFGVYSVQDLKGVLRTAYSGFAAAAQEGAALSGRPVRTLIHTGFWGCGAFGGNRMVMTILQALAADLAGVELVFHGVDVQGGLDALKGYETYQQLRAKESSVARLIRSIEARQYEWGESDGN